MPWVWMSRSRIPAARMVARSFSVFVLLAATACVAVDDFAWVPTVMLASSGGVLNDSAILTRTSGVLAISAMLAVGACCARATAGCIITAANAAAPKYLPIVTKLSLKGSRPESHVVRSYGFAIEEY